GVEDLHRFRAPAHAREAHERGHEGAQQADDRRVEPDQYEEDREREEAQQDAHEARLRRRETRGSAGALTLAPVESRRIASRWMVRKSGLAGSLPPRGSTMRPCMGDQKN